MKTDFKDSRTLRVYISNFVRRRYKGEVKCANCGTKENVSIVHNLTDPFKVSFVCNECRTSLGRQNCLNLPKIDLTENAGLNRKWTINRDMILTNELKFYVENSLNTTSTKKEYLKSINMTNEKFKRAVELYEERYSPIADKIYSHFRHLQILKRQKNYEEKNLVK